MVNAASHIHSSSGKLVVVPTPIGNLGDITLRAIEALKEADVVLAEDTRVTGKLLVTLDIKRPLERMDENILAEKAPLVADRIAQGETIAYCSDAGMPGVSDPGLRLVTLMRERALPVEVLPGASASITAYVASGCSDTRFYFGGFMPRKSAEIRTTLASLKALDAALIFYESPNRLLDSLKIIHEVFPHREVAVCRELTKLHEEVLRGTAAKLIDIFEARAASSGISSIKGEIVIVIDGLAPEEVAEDKANAEESAASVIEALLAKGVRPKEAAKTAATQCGIPRNRAYDLALSLKDRPR